MYEKPYVVVSNPGAFTQEFDSLDYVWRPQAGNDEECTTGSSAEPNRRDAHAGAFAQFLNPPFNLPVMATGFAVQVVVHDNAVTPSMQIFNLAQQDVFHRTSALVIRTGFRDSVVRITKD